MTITKADLVQNLTADTGLQKQDVKILVDNFFEIISQTLSLGEDVKISGFGSFLLRDKDERPGRNPHTGEEVIISKRRVVTFRQGQRLRDKISRPQEELAGA